MKVFVGGNGGGKTTKMLEWIKASTRDKSANRVVICHSEESVQWFRRELKKAYIEDWQVITPSKLECLRGRRFDALGIDNLELVLPQLIGYPIGLVTLSQETATVAVSAANKHLTPSWVGSGNY